MKTNEQWKKIQGFENYSVSDLGRVRNDTTGKIISIYHDKGNYSMVYLFDNGKRKAFRVHQLVARMFIPNPNNYETVNHIDTNHDNNEVSNLEWLSVGENSRRFQLEQISEEQRERRRNHCYKMYARAQEVNGKGIKCKETGIIYPSISECSRQMGIGSSSISRAVNGLIESTKGYHFEFTDDKEQ